MTRSEPGDNYDDKILVKLNKKFPINDGRLIVDRLDNKTHYISGITKNFTDWPISLSHISMATDLDVDNLLQVSKTPKNVIGTIASFMLMTKGVNTAATSERMINNFLYFRFLNGPALYYTELIFDFISESTLSLFSFKNPFEPVSSSTSAVVPENYSRRAVEPSFLFNYGLDVIGLYVTLLLNIIVYFGFFFFCKDKAKLTNIKKSKDGEAEEGIITTKSKVLTFIYRNLGFRMFISRMAGIMFQVICYASINLYSLVFDIPMILGVIQSAAFLTYYGFSAVAIIKAANQNDAKVV